MTQIKNVWNLSLKYSPFNLSEEAKYRYDCIVKYKRSPKMNGYVERANETYRYEFWNVYEIPDTIEETRKLLRKFEYKYNCERMHQSLNYLTPMEYKR
ncbi:MAG: transposase [bacterium]|nr:transposase [bacterium]